MAVRKGGGREKGKEDTGRVLGGCSGTYLLGLPLQRSTQVGRGKEEREQVSGDSMEGRQGWGGWRQSMSSRTRV